MNNKMLEYCRLRAAGVEASAAVRSAGYTAKDVGIRAAQLDARKDVQEMVAKLQRNGETDTEDADTERKTYLKKKYSNPLELFQDLMNNPDAPDALRYQAAKDALPYLHGKIGEGGKKDAEREKAHSAANGGKFQPRRGPGRPRLVN